MLLHTRIPAKQRGKRLLLRVTEEQDLPEPLRANEVLLLRGKGSADYKGFGAVVRIAEDPLHDDEIRLPASLNYLATGDILRIDQGRGELRVLYRKNSPHNTLFITERCNSRCLMCSQPPRDTNDEYLVDEILEGVPLMSSETKELCITGGEPTLLFERLTEIITAVKTWLPKTSLHMLSNGRLLTYLQYAKMIADVGHPDFMIGIPLYSDIASKHDFVVQAKGAFDQTIRGIMNLGRFKQKVEIRFVIHKQTVDRLPQTVAFIARNLPFVNHVALMGLEMTGYTRTNLEGLWIDPFEYQGKLLEAVNELKLAGIKTSIYNHQLCVLPKEIWPYARKSISDWKNVYMSECAACGMKEQCGGFFSSATLRYSKHISPLAATI